MSVWHLSDIHFGHTNLLKYQPERLTLLGISPYPGDPFDEDPKNQAEAQAFYARAIPLHDEALLTRLNEVIKPMDTALYYGDVAMGKRSETIPFTVRLHGRKVLQSAGNHDKGLWPGDRKGRDVAEQEWAEAGWVLTHSTTEYYVGWAESGYGVSYTFGHLPLLGTADHESKDGVVRYSEHMLDPAKTRRHLHGHSHGANGRVHDNGRQLDVGIDGNQLLPTSHDEVLTWLRTGTL